MDGFHKKRQLFGAAVLTLAGLLGACTAEAPPVVDTPQSNELSARDRIVLESAKIGLPPAGVSVANLPDPESEGAHAVAQYCVTCHNMPSPLLHSANDWPRVLRRMWMRIDHLAPELAASGEFVVPVPPAAERVQMLRYMLANSLQVAANLPDIPGKDLFESTCAQCHALPDPNSHSSEDWVAVIDRMMTNMDHMLGRPLDQNDRTRVTLYLQRASS